MDRVYRKKGRIYIEYKGEEQTLSQWSEAKGIGIEALKYRIRHCKGDIARIFKPWRTSKLKNDMTPVGEYGLSPWRRDALSEMRYDAAQEDKVLTRITQRQQEGMR